MSYLKLKGELNYNPETGSLWWKKSCSGRKMDKPAGTIRKDGYTQVRFKGKSYYAHVVIFMIMEGYRPRQVDHINGDRSDNRWCNLREACPRTNGYNSRVAKDNNSGYKGVDFRKDSGKWRARISTTFGRLEVGYFDSPEEAHKAYKEAADKYHGDFKNYG